jgi:multidrug efflux pump subunit AcrA (membrane-fusion protein)
MTVIAERRAGPVTLAAPIAGRVRFYPPRTLCGELEVFQAHETIATVTDADRVERIEAPGDGFLLRVLIAEGAAVEAGTPVIQFSPADGS